MAIYSGEAKGIVCMKQCVAEDQLISDYGGQGPSSAQLIHEYRKKGTLRQIVEALSLHGKEEKSFEFELAAGEKAAIIVMARSPHCTAITIKKSAGETQDEVEIEPETTDKQPYAKEVVKNLNGPGKFMFSAGTRPHHHNHDHFWGQVAVYNDSKIVEG